MPVPPQDDGRALAQVLPSSWGPLVGDDRALPVDRVARLVAAHTRSSVDDAADMLNAMPNRHRYLLLARIGETDRSVVYAAVDRMLAREVAIKLHRDREERANTRVMAEVRAMSAVVHPNIVQVFDVGEHDGLLYSVTELCEQDLHTWCPERGWSEIVERILEAGCGLAAVHAAGLVHGDIKPTNILIKDGMAKLADFGLVGRPGLSLGFVGTPGFIAPETAAGQRSSSGDVFALAASAWSCLFHGLPFGTPPERGGLQAAVIVGIERASNGELATPKRMPEGMPLMLLDAVRMGLHPDPHERPTLGPWLDHLHTIRSGTEQMRRLWRWWPAAAGVLVMGALGFGGYRLVSRGEQREISDEASESAGEDAEHSNPCDDAQRAARAGDGGGVITALNLALTKFDTYSSAEKIRLANTATAIAEQLEAAGQRDHAQIVWTFAILFHSRDGGGVIVALNLALIKFDTYTPAEKIRLANMATTIAEQLETAGQRDDAQIVWSFATLFHSRVGQLQEVERAQVEAVRAGQPVCPQLLGFNASEAVISAPTQNR